MKFMNVFVIVMLMFSGSFYFSLRYDDSMITHNGSNSTSPGGGVNADLQRLDGLAKLLHEVYFTGLRTLVEAGSVLDYYGSSGSLRYMYWSNNAITLQTLLHGSTFYMILLIPT